MFSGALLLGLAVVTIGGLIAVASTFLELVFIHSVATAGFAKHCFVASFTLCGLLFAALLLELLGVLPAAVGSVLLGNCVTALVCTVTFVLPGVTLHALLRHSVGGDGWFARGAAVACIIGAWSAMAALVSPCSSTDDVALGLAADASLCTGMMDGVSSRAAFIGVVVVSILGGYAILSTPVAYVEPLIRWRAVAAAERSVAVLCQRQLYVLKMWSTRRAALALAVHAAHKGAAAGQSGSSSGGGGLFGRIRSALADSSSSSAATLAVECAGYAQVSGGVFLSAQEAAERSTHTANIRSARGAIFGVYGVILAAYCVVKLLVTAVNLILGRFSTVDPVTRALNLVGVVTGSDVIGSTSLETLALVFNTLMILSAIRGFLLLVFRLTCNNRAATPEASLLVLSLFMSYYFLGTATLLRLSLPPEFRPQLTRALGALPFRYYHWYNDVGMLISAAVTALILRWYGAVEEFDA